ncbi:MAG: hypothetical protein ACLROI_00120 [Beduini sp.]|uniref:hypothetical protein n=1 Tax=Beduini sp. TaxID=1922300 RepID=UPI0011CC139D
MKLAVKFSFLFICMFIFFICLSDINGRPFKINETHSISYDSTYYPLKQLASPYHQITSNDQLVAEVLKQVVLSKQSDCDIKVQILGVDHINGLLDVNIIQTYQHINGKEEVIQSRQTIIIEEEL